MPFVGGCPALKLPRLWPVELEARRARPVVALLELDLCLVKLLKAAAGFVGLLCEMTTEW